MTKLVEMLALVKGELEQVERLLGAAMEQDAGLLARRAVLLGQHDALCVTLRQFDPELNLEAIAAQALPGRRKG